MLKCLAMKINMKIKIFQKINKSLKLKMVIIKKKKN